MTWTSRSFNKKSVNRECELDFSWLIKEKKLTAIPVSAFYSKDHKHIGEKYLRFCFIKDKKTLDTAAQILKQWKAEM